MTGYQRQFGSGPRGLFLSALLLAVAWFFSPAATRPRIHGRPSLGLAVLALATLLTLALAVWSFRSLPPNERGKTLATRGAYCFFRHPLYASFLTFFNFGLAFYLDNWIYVAWALVQHPLWHWNLRGEEALVRQVFGAEYAAYCERTGRFVPRFWR